ncbi:SYRV3 [Symbiodinium necroappetens]|uniref:SYRV3 protein n=2 Tax=Symbiodinium TaxID=2949 RepID=A0A812JML0_9DINO|nr:SYRV3 [Symbiodinium necroappetens]CAE7882635.1 SYRV3 [Symbiodinium microadriaticum]|mmetsp:Transcript_23400/g.55586  ORF Transcript_23400/g.55586 Transcript_23400/m.55586 type:complete len:370 (+) Transcript_23400:45-1154(+)
MSTPPAEKLLEVKHTLHQVLRRVDSNGDGYIDKDELYYVLDRVGTFKKAKWSNLHETLDRLLAGLDTNGDGFVDVDEFLDWVLLDKTEVSSLHTLQTRHIFLSAEDEARMERIALFDLECQENNGILAQAGLCELTDPKLLLLSVGSSSTQAYDAAGLSVSVPTGTKVVNGQALQDLISGIKQPALAYREIVLINSIGYLLKPNDPVLVDLKELATRSPESAAQRFHVALKEAFPLAQTRVYNRAKDPQTKRYKFPQLLNDFSLSLTKGCGLPEESFDFHPDIIVDWGGSSYKVFMDGKRIGTEVMDANAFLCDGDTLLRDRLPIAVKEIEACVLALLQREMPERSAHKKVLIAQTGKARELAMRGCKI